ncbi:MAG: hypothetical protein E3J54_00840 [Actinobacteria bacterium]|nr:MAG: hypothetical protein E3J54_00840 [Actinomycetota bacterium]
MPQFGRYSSKNLFKDATSTLMGLKQLKQQKELAGERTEIMKTQAETSAGHLKLKEEAVPTAERPIGDKGIETTASGLTKMPKAVTPVTSGDIAAMEAHGEALDKQTGAKLSVGYNMVANRMKDLTAQGYKRIDIYRDLKSGWPKYAEATQVEIKKTLVSEMNKPDGDQGKIDRLVELHTAVGSTDWLDAHMPASARYERDIQYERDLAEKKLPKAKVPKTERLYETVGGWQPRKEAVGKLKPVKKGGKLTEKQKRQKTIRDNYYKQITQARSAAKGIDPIMKDMEVDVKAVRADAIKKADILASEYVKAGGKLEDLGLAEEKPKGKAKKYKSDQDIKAAFQKGEITEQEAIKLLTGK